jgi:hypothetical protein
MQITAPRLFTFLIGNNTIIYEKIKPVSGSAFWGSAFLIFGQEGRVKGYQQRSKL